MGDAAVASFMSLTCTDWLYSLLKPTRLVRARCREKTPEKKRKKKVPSALCLPISCNSESSQLNQSPFGKPKQVE